MKRKGFTIIELLVVVAIISIIASVALSMFGEPRARSRDARRAEDMKELHNGLSLYVNDYGTYPICDLTKVNGKDDCLSKALRDAGAMKTVPFDPIDTGSCGGLPNSPQANASVYCYRSETNGTSFSLYYHLETDSTERAGWHNINP